MRKIFRFLFFISSLVSCEVDEEPMVIPDTNGVQIFCNEINTRWPELDTYTFTENFGLDINSDSVTDFTFSSYEFSNAWYNTHNRTIIPSTGFEILTDSAKVTYWEYVQAPDTTYDTSYYHIATKIFSGALINIDDYFSTGGNSFTQSTTQNNYPFPHGTSQYNPWYISEEGFVVFKNESLGIMGWIKMGPRDVYGRFMIIKSYYTITHHLLIDESICQ